MRNMFAKRHYEAIAAAMKTERPGDHWDANKRLQWDRDVLGLIDLFVRDNLAFRPSQFLEACGGLFNA